EAQRQRLAERAHEHRLAEPRHAFEQHVAAGDERDHGVAHELFLADDQARELGLQRLRQLGDPSRVGAWLFFGDHCPVPVAAPPVSPRLEKYWRIKSLSLPGIKLWLVASRATCW